MALYNWNEKEAVFYNGIMQWLGCCIDVINYIIISITPVGKMYFFCVITNVTAASISFMVLNIQGQSLKLFRFLFRCGQIA